MRRYTPDDCSADEYQKRSRKSPAKAAVLQAAQLSSTIVMRDPTVVFAASDEAKLNRQLSEAQRLPASLAPLLDQYFQILKSGDSDRENVTEPRWQAAFDLAMGQVLAAQTRIEGYNLMLAALKRGKSFTNPASTHWRIVPAANFESGSAIRKKGESAEKYLKRVADQHPGTPWAWIATEELNRPTGWTWVEESQ